MVGFIHPDRHAGADAGTDQGPSSRTGNVVIRNGRYSAHYRSKRLSRSPTIFVPFLGITHAALLCSVLLGLPRLEVQRHGYAGIE
jgi:hypothetical protein